MTTATANPGARSAPAPTAATAAYLDRIGVTVGPGEAGGLDLLRRIVRAHVATIPFENLDPFTGTEPPTTGEGVAAKLVAGGRGGWCFEHNRLLYDVLADLGHRVTPLVGRVRLGLDDDAPATTRTHRLTLLRTVEGSVTADVGFGGTVPTEPLRLVTGTVQPTPHGDYRYRRDGDGTWLLQRRGAGDWTTQYTFDLTATPDVDYAMGSWYLTHHPDSGFRNGVVAARSADDHRVTLDGTRLTVRHVDGRTDRDELDSPSAVRRALEDRFGIDTAGVPGLERRIREVHFA